MQAEPGRDVKVGKLKSATSKRTVPLNDTAIAMIQDLRKEAYFGEDTPLVPNEHGDFTRPVNFRKRYYRILAAAGNRGVRRILSDLLVFSRAPRCARKPERPDRPHARQDEATSWGTRPRGLGPRARIYCGVRKPVALPGAVFAHVRA